MAEIETTEYSLEDGAVAWQVLTALLVKFVKQDRQFAVEIYEHLLRRRATLLEDRLRSPALERAIEEVELLTPAPSDPPT